jgi:GTP-binding protein HflX
LKAVETRLAEGRHIYTVTLEPSDGKGLHWLYEHAETISRRDDEDGTIHLTVRVGPDRARHLHQKFANVLPALSLEAIEATAAPGWSPTL